jgi:CDP-diacylglycerol--serine O-phosphatidyltransferase
MGRGLFWRLGAADAITATNAGLGFLAAALAPVSPSLAARLVLLGAIADGLDGVVARRYGGSEVGWFLDSLADVATFCVAPAAVVLYAAGGPGSLAPRSLAVLVLTALFVTAGVLRLGLYSAYDEGNGHTEGVPTTLAATVLAAALLAGVPAPLLLAATLAFTALMLTGVTYPDLYARDAVAMGAVQALALAFPGVLGGAFVYLLLAAALAYLLLAPRFYWRA